VDTDLRTITTR